MSDRRHAAGGLGLLVQVVEAHGRRIRRLEGGVAMEGEVGVGSLVIGDVLIEDTGTALTATRISTGNTVTIVTV